MRNVVTRFAPSPTGHLHIGGARTALFSWLLARHFNGTFRLRIEDTDIERSKQEYIHTILDSMRWLGLSWDGEVTYQSQRMKRYNEVVEKLLATKHAYWCHCSHEALEKMREDARKKGMTPRYSGYCREKKLGFSDAGVVRLRVPHNKAIVFEDLVKGQICIQTSEIDDMVIRRSDGTATYQLAVVVDDHDMDITHVIRGDDHVSNTPKQILLYEALGWNIPLFGHIPMILGPDRQKLSKRHGARAVIEYQEDGFLPQALINYLARLGWSHGNQELFTVQELVQFFDGTNLHTAPSAFDIEKLLWLNSHYLRELTVYKLSELILPFLIKEGIENITNERVKAAISLYKERCVTLVELAKYVKIVLQDASNLVYDENAVRKTLTFEGKRHLLALRQLLEKENEIDFNQERIETIIHSYLETNSVKFKEIGPVLRVAMSGVLGGPSLQDFIVILGKIEVLARIDRMLQLV